MTSKKLFIGLVAVTTVGVIAAACGSSKKSSTPTLASGSYGFDAAPAPTVTPDTCFGAADEATIGGILTGGTLTIVSTNGTTFILEPPSVAASLIPPMDGTIAGTVLTAAGGPIPLALMSNCTLSLSLGLAGNLTADNSFDATITLGAAASLTTASHATPNCNSLANSTAWSSGFLHFPTVGSNGSCSLGIVGHVSQH